MRRTGSLSWTCAVLLLLTVCLGRSDCYEAESGMEDRSEQPEESQLEVEQPGVYREDMGMMRDRDEFIRYMVNDVLFPVEGIIKGYCLYRSVSNELKEDASLFSKESVVVATILLSGKWKNPLGFVSHCKQSLRKVSNGMKTSSLEHSIESWASLRSKRKATKISRIKICFRAKVCSRMMKKHEGIENLRRFLMSRTQYGLIYPDQGSEMAVWNTVQEFKDILSAGILKGDIKNHIRVLVLFNYVNKILNQVGKYPASLFVCIALINTMVRERSLSEWLSFMGRKSSRTGKTEGGLVDPVTNLRYDTSLKVKENIKRFQVRTCNHVIWTSGIILSERQVKFIGESSDQVLTLRRRISWMCDKMFSM